MLLSAVVALAADPYIKRQVSGAPQRYSYYSPGTGTINLDNTVFEKDQLALDGQALSGDIIVLTGLSRTLARLTPKGRVRWTLNVKGGGGAYGLAHYRGLLLVCFGQDILAISPQTGRVVSRLNVLPAPDTNVLNFLRVQGDVLIAGDSAEHSTLHLAKLSTEPDGKLKLVALEKIQTRLLAPRDAVLAADDELMVADTFGHAVVFYKKRAHWREVRRIPEFYPNMLNWNGEELTILSEHGNRLVNWHTQTNQKRVLIACPLPLFEDSQTLPQQIVAEESQTRSSEAKPRQRCAADIIGAQTLYAANGFHADGNRQIWVADADNHRVAYFVDGQFRGAITGINHPVRVMPVSEIGR